MVTERCNIQLKIDQFVQYLKDKTVINLKDVEMFYTLIIGIESRIEELTKSRDNWKKKYLDLLNSTKK